MNPQFVAVAQLGFTLDRADEARRDVGFRPQSRTSIYRRFVP